MVLDAQEAGDYLSQRVKAAVAAFVVHWETERSKAPEMYPAELPPEEWEEQFWAFMGS